MFNNFECIFKDKQSAEQAVLVDGTDPMTMIMTPFG